MGVVDRNPFLHPHGAANRAVNAIEHNKQKVAPSLDDPAVMFFNRGIDQVFAERPQPLQGSGVVQPNQSAVTYHVGIDDGNQLAPISRFIRCGGLSHSLRHSRRVQPA